jgi:hypothetical protein
MTNPVWLNKVYDVAEKHHVKFAVIQAVIFLTLTLGALTTGLLIGSYQAMQQLPLNQLPSYVKRQ